MPRALPEAARPGSSDGSLSYAVALCTYNGARYVGEQLRSILAQRPRCAQLIVVDDASTDDSASIARSLLDAEGVRGVVSVNPANLGSLKSFERALGLVTDLPIVFLADQDDAWHANKAARMLDAFERRPELLLLNTNARIVDASMRPLGYDLFTSIHVTRAERRRLRHGDAFDAYIRRNVATGATVAFRRELLDIALPIPEGWVHDEWLATIASAIGRVDYLEDPLIDYRQHGGNQIGALRLSLGRKLELTLGRPRDWYVRQIDRTEALLDRLASLGDRVPADRLVKVHRKLRHLTVRRDLPPRRLGRWIPILREALAGRYARYSTGLRSIAIDLWRRG